MFTALSREVLQRLVACYVLPQEEHGTVAKTSSFPKPLHFPSCDFPAHFSSSSLHPHREAHPGGGLLRRPRTEPLPLTRQRGAERIPGICLCFPILPSFSSPLLPFSSPPFLPFPPLLGDFSSSPTPLVISIAKSNLVCLRCETTRTPGVNCSLFPRDRWPSPSITLVKAHRVLVPILSSYLGFILSDCPASPAQRTPRGAGWRKGCGRWWGVFLCL